MFFSKIILLTELAEAYIQLLDFVIVVMNIYIS
jgi:hypothetical protein